MRLKKLFILSAVALLGAAPAKITAQTWQTILDWQLVAGKSAGGGCIAADPFGNVFWGGGATDALGTNHAIVLKTTDQYQSPWLLSDDTNPDYTKYQCDVRNVGVDTGGNVYSIEEVLPDNNGAAYWYVRKSPDSGATWSPVDHYQYTPGQFAAANGFAADDTGVYVVGWARDLTVTGSGKHATTNSNIHWLVRKSTDGGSTWTNVDDVILVNPATGGECSAWQAASVLGKGVFVVGTEFVIPGSWVVRRSIDAGATWSTVDGPFANGSAQAVCSDSLGNIYVSGAQFIATRVVRTKGTTVTNGYYAWITRESTDGGTHWSTVDTYTYGITYSKSPQFSAARGSGTDSAGNVVVVGRATDAQGIGHGWVVRRHDSSGWHTIDDFQTASGWGTAWSGVATDAAGNLLVTGEANDGTSWHWIVRLLPKGQ
jgi:hypothetical protein